METDPPKGLDRRDWLRGALGAVLLSSPSRADGPPPGVAEVEERARKVKLGPFRRTETAHFLAVGDAPGDYRAEALNACEKMGKDLVDHFLEKGFAGLTFPRTKLLVVILADARSYASFSGEDPGIAVGGHFDLDANRLVTFDFRDDQGRLNQAAQRVNTLVLMHETTHQLTFNIGLLDLKGDVPACISEGLATYGETWRPRDKGKIGQVNHDRLAVFKPRGVKWIPLPRLIVEDALLEDEATQDRAYAESWVLVHAHLKDPARLPKLRAYLAAIKPRRDPKARLEDARAHLGDLDKLDADLRRYASRPKV